MKVQKQCLVCNKDFMADTRELNRGNAKFCSRSCGMKNSNLNKILIDQKCETCNIDFKSKNKSKYCCRNCKSIAYRKKQKFTGIGIRSIYSQTKDVPCCICGWKETTRDIHHIIPVSKGGTNDLSNLVVLCPNHHRMVHDNLISENSLINAALSRTISSS